MKVSNLKFGLVVLISILTFTALIFSACEKENLIEPDSNGNSTISNVTSNRNKSTCSYPFAGTPADILHYDVIESGEKVYFKRRYNLENVSCRIDYIDGDCKVVVRVVGEKKHWFSDNEYEVLGEGCIEIGQGSGLEFKKLGPLGNEADDFDVIYFEAIAEGDPQDRATVSFVPTLPL